MVQGVDSSNHNILILGVWLKTSKKQERSGLELEEASGSYSISKQVAIHIINDSVVW
jgi:hypothetical protein